MHAVGGSWLCAKADISAGNFNKITALCQEALEIAAGFELAHLGINTNDAEASFSIAKQLSKAFGFEVKEGANSNFAGNAFEVMKSACMGAKGHIAIRTNSIQRAIAYLEKRGFSVDPETAKVKNSIIAAIYLKGEIGGFAIHLIQK